MICAIVLAEPILHSEFLPSIKVTDVGFQATIKIFPMNSFCPAIPQLLCHVAPGEDEPLPIEPEAALVLAGHPNHHWRRIHHLAKSRIEPACRLDGMLVEAALNHINWLNAWFLRGCA